MNDMDRQRLVLYKRRKHINIVALTLSMAAMAFGLVWLFWILIETFRLGFNGLALATLTQITPPPNEEGGFVQCHLRLFLDGDAGHLCGHAHWDFGWYLPR